MQALSKINLFLNVFKERADGYHELDTIFFPLAAPADEVDMDFSGSGVRIECSDPGVPLDPAANLCGRAVSAYAQATGMPVPACVIRLKKAIPCAGGMGGGSSDAAAVLNLMQVHFQQLTKPELAAAALTIGADVPFFLDPLPARATGVGEKLVPLPRLPKTLPLLVAAPGFPVSAKWAYQHWSERDALPQDAAEKLIAALESNDLEAAARFVGNSLSAPLFRKFPLLSLIRKAFADTGALCADVTGSGPCLFALYRDFQAAQTAKERLARQFEAVRFFVPAGENR